MKIIFLTLINTGSLFATFKRHSVSLFPYEFTNHIFIMRSISHISVVKYLEYVICCYLFLEREELSCKFPKMYNDTLEKQRKKILMIERRDCGKVEKYLVKEKLINLIRSITLIVNLKACLHLLFHFLKHIKPLPNQMSSTSLRKK